MDRWDPAQYELFKQERSQPGRDLIALVQPQPGARAIDLGCGTGELTAQLHRHCQAGETLGIDSSAAMLEQARRHGSAYVRFELKNIRELPAEPRYDVIFSNAALHWLPDHAELFGFLTDRLVPGGQLAVQMPAMSQQPVHTIARDVARLPRFAPLLDGFAHVLDVLSPDDYAALLWRLGYAEQSVRLQIYAHVLPGPESAIEWIQGSMLTAYRERLAPADYDDFVAEYRQRLLAALPPSRPCYFPYRRILIWGRRER